MSRVRLSLTFEIDEDRVVSLITEQDEYRKVHVDQQEVQCWGVQEIKIPLFPFEVLPAASGPPSKNNIQRRLEAIAAKCLSRSKESG